MGCSRHLAHHRAGGDGAALAGRREADRALNRRPAHRASTRGTPRCPRHRNESRDLRRSPRAPSMTGRRWPFRAFLRPAQFQVVAYAPAYQKQNAMVPPTFACMTTGLTDAMVGFRRRLFSTSSGELMARFLLFVAA